MKLWEAYARPVIEYAAEVWRPDANQAKKLEATVCDFARHGLGVDARCGNDFLLTELGLVSPAARREELKLRFFRHLCMAEADRALSKVFRYRCEQVKEGRAKKSLCADYRDLLVKHGLEDKWDGMPSNPKEWSGWDTQVHKAAALRDVADRRARLAQHVSMEQYLKIKPMIKPSRSAYVYGRGLGVWLKLRLRADNLPLLTVLSRTSRPRMTTRCARCALCATGALEDVSHFLVGCPALQVERGRLWTDIVNAMRPLTDECALAQQVCVVVEGSDDVAKLGLLLDTHEEPTTSSEEERREKKAAAARAGTSVRREVDRIAREYFVRVWRKRAQLLGGVPSLDNRGYKMVLGALRPDGRCASWVDAAHAVA